MDSGGDPDETLALVYYMCVGVDIRFDGPADVYTSRICACLLKLDGPVGGSRRVGDYTPVGTRVQLRCG